MKQKIEGGTTNYPKQTDTMEVKPTTNYSKEDIKNEGIMETLIKIYCQALEFSRKANQVVGENHDYYITMEQLERLIKPYDSK